VEKTEKRSIVLSDETAAESGGPPPSPEGLKDPPISLKKQKGGESFGVVDSVPTV